MAYQRMSAADYFDGVRRAAVEVERCQRLINELRDGDIPRHSSDGPHGKGAYSDPTADTYAAMVSMMDGAIRRRDACQELIGEALVIIDGLRRVYDRMAEVMELYYVDLKTWDEIADELHVSNRTVRRWRDVQLSWLDDHPRSYVMACRFISTYNI